MICTDTFIFTSMWPEPYIIMWSEPYIVSSHYDYIKRINIVILHMRLIFHYGHMPISKFWSLIQNR
jgi:hypothetical protein